MGAINYGNQTLSFDYNQDATSRLFNNTSYKLIPTGIYEGFNLVKLTNSMISVNPDTTSGRGVCYISDSGSNLGCRIEVNSPVNLNVSHLNSRRYIILRFMWVDSINNFADFLVVDFDSIEADDLILGRIVYDGSVLRPVFDLSRRHNHLNFDKVRTKDYFKVLPNETNPQSVIVTSGVISSPDGSVPVPSATLSIPNCANGRHDLIYINRSWEIDVIIGVESATPVTPRYGDRKVIAEIRRTKPRTSVSGDEIVQIISNFDFQATPVDTLLINSTEPFSANESVESAIDKIARKPFEFIGSKIFRNFIQLLSGVSIKGVGEGDILSTTKADNSPAIRINKDGVIKGVPDPVEPTDAVNKSFSSNASNLSSGKISKDRFDNLELLGAIKEVDGKLSGLNTQFFADRSIDEMKYPSDDGLIAYWNFNNTPEYPDNTANLVYFKNNFSAFSEWTPNSGTTLSVVSKKLIIDVTNDDPFITMPKIFDGSKNSNVRIKIKQLAGSALANGMAISWKTAGHGYSNDYKYIINKQISNEWTIFDFYMPSAVGGSEWSVTTITELKIDIAEPALAGQKFEIDWIYVGDGNYSAKISDNSGNGYNGSIYGAYPINSVSGKGIYLNGIRNYVEFPPLNGIRGDFSLSFWVKPSRQHSVVENIISFGSAVNGITLSKKPNTQNVDLIVKKASTTEIIPDVLVLGTSFFHVAVVYTSADKKFSVYKDGVLSSENIITSIVLPVTKLLIGTQNNSNDFFQGIVDEVKFYNKPITPQMIYQLFNTIGGVSNIQVSIGNVADSVVMRNSDGNIEDASVFAFRKEIKTGNLLTEILTNGTVLTGVYSSDIGVNNTPEGASVSTMQWMYSYVPVSMGVDSGILEAKNLNNNRWSISRTLGVWGTWGKVWTSSNMGHNSGLNSDTVDDKHVGTSGDKIPVLNANNSWGGSQNFTEQVAFSVPNVAPFAVASSVIVEKLNSEMVGGKKIGTTGDTIPSMAGSNSWDGNQRFSSIDFGANTVKWVWNVDKLECRRLSNGAVLFYISNTGDVYIGNDIYIYSKKENKENIKKMDESALEIINSVNVVHYNMKVSPDKPRIGFIADEAPIELCAPNRSGQDIPNTINILIKAVQELYKLWQQ